MKKYIDGNAVQRYLSVDDDLESEEKFWNFIAEEVENSIYSDFRPNQQLKEVIAGVDPDYFEWLSDCGKRVHMRVYLWAEGFYMACGQLGI